MAAAHAVYLESVGFFDTLPLRDSPSVAAQMLYLFVFYMFNCSRRSGGTLLACNMISTGSCCRASWVVVGLT